jgi:hypothetical protein
MAVGETATLEIVPVATRQLSGKKRYIMPAVTPEMAEQVGEMVGQGIKLDTALAALPTPITLEHWDRAIGMADTGSSVLRAFRSKAAQAEIALLAQVAPENKGWQAAAWRLERSRGYTVAKGGGVTVNVNTINGMDNTVLKRARTLFAAKPAKVKQVE